MPEIRFHDLQHTAASLMLNNGIPVIVVSRRLGHARPSITLDVYGHLIPSKQQEAAEKMDELISDFCRDCNLAYKDCTRNQKTYRVAGL